VYGPEPRCVRTDRTRDSKTTARLWPITGAGKAGLEKREEDGRRAVAERGNSLARSKEKPALVAFGSFAAANFRLAGTRIGREDAI